MPAKMSGEPSPYKVEAHWAVDDLKVGRWPRRTELKKYVYDDEGQTRIVDRQWYAIEAEAEAAAPLREALRDVLDHSIPQHSSACAAQDEDDDCICETGPLMDRAYAMAVYASGADADTEDDGRTKYVLVKGEDRQRIDAAVADVLAYEAAMTMPEPEPEREPLRHRDRYKVEGWQVLGTARAAGTEDTNDPTA